MPDVVSKKSEDCADGSKYRFSSGMLDYGDQPPANVMYSLQIADTYLQSTLS